MPKPNNSNNALGDGVYLCGSEDDSDDTYRIVFCVATLSVQKGWPLKTLSLSLNLVVFVALLEPSWLRPFITSTPRSFDDAALKPFTLTTTSRSPPPHEAVR
ncbi:hypothetical protein TRIUR3_21166 [Triticum urartu]|uniref:Uncharacterized protein n=1 Tax=Triticum urartu TaxID=4572 RepID=M8AUQ4_TRIUA|nr:hypothetical protein TRIUR3_21166 [Triticum urartu]